MNYNQDSFSMWDANIEKGIIDKYTKDFPLMSLWWLYIAMLFVLDPRLVMVLIQQKSIHKRKNSNWICVKKTKQKKPVWP